MAVTGIEELVVWTPPKELDTTGEEVDVVEHLRFLMGEFVKVTSLFGRCFSRILEKSINSCYNSLKLVQ